MGESQKTKLATGQAEGLPDLPAPEAVDRADDVKGGITEMMKMNMECLAVTSTVKSPRDSASSV